MKSLLLASGFGTRLYPLNSHKPKALIQYKGIPLINHILNKIPENIPVLVNSNKKFEQDFREWQETLNRNITLCVEPVYDEKQAFGAIGSILYWIKAKNISEDLLVIGTDNYFDFDLLELIKCFDGEHAVVAVHDIGDTSKACQYGVVLVDGHKAIELEEKPAQPKCSLIATACYIFPKRVFPLLFSYCAEGKKDNLGGFISYLIERDKVLTYVFPGRWFDVGSLEVFQSIQNEPQSD
jgi:glucose-1-phosphate thymidylyltransferase